MAQKTPSFWFSVRVLVAVAGFFGYFIQYIQRVNISVAIVCMVNHTAVLQQTYLQDTNLDLQSSNISNIIEEKTEKCYFDDAADVGGKSSDGKFVWDKQTQGLVLSSYFYGYISTQIIGGFLSFKLGATIVIGVSMLIGSIMTILNPVAANTSWIAIVLCRAVLGMTHGVFWPGMSSLWANWAVPSERSRLVGLANSGSQIGNIVALPLSGVLCVYGFAEGWGSIFYIFGGVGIVWFVFWMLVTAKSPKEHRFIGEEEKEYIMSQTNSSGAKLPPTPWLKIATSRSFWALIFAHSCSNFGTYLFLMQLPTYMKEVLKFNIKSNGTLSAAPYILFWALIVGSSVIGDKLIETKKLTKQNVRRLFNTIGLIVPMAATIGLIFVTCATPYVGIGLLVVGLAFTGCCYGAGWLVNYNDIAGPYAGIALGMANTIGSSTGFIAPYMVGVLTPHQTQGEWQHVFIVTAVVYLIGAIAYFVLCKGDLEPWAKVNKKQDDAEEQPLREN